MKTSVMFITPEKAEELLMVNINNRPIRNTWVKQLADAIKRGEWKTTHQGLAISKTGKLLDGQHRLMAISASGVGCHMAVAFDVDDDSYVCMDIGAKRNINDMFGIGLNTAEVLRFAAKLVFSGAPTPQQVQMFIDTPWHQASELLKEHCNTAVKIYSSVPMRFAAVYRYVEVASNDAHKAIIFDQYKALCTHDFDSMDQTSKAYVKSIMSSGKGAVVDQTTRFVHGMKVFNPKARTSDRFRMLDSEFTSIASSARAEIRKQLKI